MNSFGWIENKEAVKQTLNRLANPLFLTSKAATSSTTLPDEIFLWDAAIKVLGHVLPGRNQGDVGSCVSFGTASAIEYTMLNEIVLGQLEEYKDLCQEAIYGGSRIEIGKGQVSGDGSIGSWAAEFVEQYGLVARGVYKDYNLESYDETRCRLWGRDGLPDDLEPEAKKHPVKTVSMIRSYDEAKKALASGYGISVCSNQGFTMDRDKDGFARPMGSWGHCMAIIGYQTKRPGCFILNSWGDDSHTGPVGLGNTPVAGFWADAKIVDRMLAAKDSWAFSCVEGFPVRKLNYFI